MYKFLLLVAAVFSLSLANAQTFNGTGGAIPDGPAPAQCFPITVSGVGIIDATHGIASVCIDITHTLDADLAISLVGPNGYTVMLSNQHGSTGDNYTGTCFSMAATVDVAGGNPPFSGSYIPDQDLGYLNSGQNADGVWTLCISDGFGGETGTLNNWSINFTNTPAPPPPVIPNCGGNPPAGNTCSSATPVCNFDGYCGNTSSAYSIDTWTELSNAFCGSIDNNSFITFVASATSASFNVYVYNSQNDDGIQMFFYDGGCGSGAINTYGCYNQILPDIGAVLITATGLTPGNTYVLMFDGFSGDVCDYSIEPLDGVNILAVTPPSTSICVGQSVSLTASGGNGVYTWAGPNLNTNTGATVIATPTVTTTYTVTSVDPTGSCPITKEVVITITSIAPPPVVTSPLSFCQGAATTALTATGTSLSWFTTATGGTASATAPTPTSTTIGSTTYYVSQTLICGESVRVPIVVNIVAPPVAPTVTTPVSYCQSGSSFALTATGTGLLWYTTATGGTGSATAPIPSTTTAGSTIYYVSQTVSTCEGPRAAITVTINTTPVAPSVTSPVSYCQGNTATALTATGVNLLWYTTATGGTGSATAPTPATTTVGTTTWYVSQANGTCRGPRAPIVVNVVLATPAPTTATITFCQGSTATALTATGTSLLWYTTSTGGTGTATAPIPATTTIGSTTYYVTQTLSCGESIRQPLIVNIISTPAAPVVSSPLAYCQGTTAAALTATGTGLLWYTTATGGTGSAAAPLPVTTTVGNTIYYVSQSTGSCEGPRAAITVTVNAIPAAPGISSPVNYCQGITATPLTATGTALLWYTTATGGTGNITAPTASTTTVGNTIYYVSQTINTCESPRAAITVTILPSTVLPTATSPVTYCQGASPSALTATGTGLLWYTVAMGGTGTTVAPTPSTVATGTTTYYVSQTATPCGESGRRPVVVNITATPLAPVVTSPVVYCQNTTAAALTATGTALLWYTTATGGTGTTAAPVPSTTTVGNTIYYVSQRTGTCEGPRAAITVTISSIPAAPGVTSTFTYCQGIAATVLSATGSNLLWYTTATGGTGSITAPTPATSTAGTVTYYVTQTINTCQGPRASIAVTTLPPTALPTATSPVIYCQGTTAVALTATGTGLLWYTVATGGTGSTVAPTPSTSIAGSTTYFVSQTAAPCGESARKAVVVTINSTPLAPVVASPVVHCQGTTASALTATGTALLWYTTATGGTGTATAPVPSTATVGNTIYYVSQATGACEGPRAAITVTVNSIPAAPAVTSTFTYCQGIAASALSATGSNLLWYTAAAGGTGTAIAPTPSTIAPGITTYYVSQTINTCEGPRSSIEITVLPYTLVPAATSPVIFCQGTTATALTATGTGLLWYTTATGGTGTATAPVPSTSTVGATTYYVTQTGICGESNRRPVVVNINPIPVAPTTAPVTICQNATAPALTATGSNLLWYTAPTGGSGTAALIPSTVAVGTTTYYVSQTVGTCEGPRATITVTVVALPPAPAGSGPFTYCQGITATQLTATGTGLLWYTTATGGTGSTTAPVPATSAAGTFTYYVTQTFPCGESPRTAIVVKVNPTPLAPAVTSPVTYCQGTATIPLAATGTNLLWYTNPTGGVGNTTAPTPSSSTVNNLIYYVSSTLGTCEGPRAALNVIVNSTPAAPVVGAALSYCQDALVAPLSATGTNLLWYTTATGGIGAAAAPDHYTALTGIATYYVSQTTGVCEGPRASITVTINPYPNFGPDLRDTVCAGDSVNLTQKFNTTGYTIQWTLDGETVTAPGTVKTTGVYQLEATNSVGCSDTVLVYVTVQPVVPAFAGNDTTAMKGLPQQLMGSGGIAYTWSPANPLNNSTIQNPLATLDHDQLFELTVTDAAGCTGKDKVFIQVYNGPTYYVPNAFSPNGDGLNDIFRVIPVGITRTDWFRVFNRFGQLVFESNKWLKGWDGSYLGKKQPVGNYIWMIKGINRFGKVVEMKGTVLIVQ